MEDKLTSSSDILFANVLKLPLKSSYIHVKKNRVIDCVKCCRQHKVESFVCQPA